MGTCMLSKVEIQDIVISQKAIYGRDEQGNYYFCWFVNGIDYCNIKTLLEKPSCFVTSLDVVPYNIGIDNINRISRVILTEACKIVSYTEINSVYNKKDASIVLKFHNSRLEVAKALVSFYNLFKNKTKHLVDTR